MLVKFILQFKTVKNEKWYTNIGNHDEKRYYVKH
jgi:hypothetical protein